MTTFRQNLRRTLLILAGLGLGVVLAAWSISQRSAPARAGADAAEQVARPALQVITVQPLPLRIQASGLGSARAAERWQAVATVAARVVERHPDLDSGVILPAGALLLRLDPSRFELAMAEAEAEGARLDADLAKLEVEAESTQRLLALEQERLALTQQELARIESLAASGSAARSQRDEQRRADIAQRRAVATLEQELNSLPARRAELAARRARAEVQLAQARADLDDTRFVAPYDLRFAEVEVERHQYVTVGQRLFSADNLSAAEVEAHIPLGALRELLGSLGPAAKPDTTPDTKSDTTPAASTDADTATAIPAAQPLAERLDFAAVAVEVRLIGHPQVRWPARLVQVASGLDPVTRSARVVVRVAHPYRDARPPDRLVLQPGMLTRVTLAALAPAPRLLVPTQALHQGQVYRVDGENRLRHTPVEIAFTQGELAVIAAGLAAGDRIIVDDPLPAIDGQLIDPHPDPAWEAALRAQAQGAAP